MLKQLSTSKMVAPTGVKLATESEKTERLLANLESVVSKKFETV